MVEILDSGQKLAASGEIPLSIRQKMPEDQVNVFYLHQNDWIVLNSRNKNFPFYKEMLEKYLQLSDQEKHLVNEFALSKGMTFFKFINSIVRIRRKKKKSTFTGWQASGAQQINQVHYNGK